MRWRFLVGIMVWVAAVAGATGCGGDTTKDAASLLDETFGGSRGAIASGQLNLNLALDFKGSGSRRSGPIALAVSGPFENRGQGAVPRFDFSVNLDSSGQQLQASGVSTGTKGYLRFGGEVYELGSATYRRLTEGFQRARRRDAKQDRARPTFAALGVDPRGWLRNPRRVGTEKVGGTETVHITAGVDVVRLLEDVNRLIAGARKIGAQTGRVPSALTAAERSRAAEALSNVEVDVWTGAKDSRLRRFSLGLDFAVSERDRARVGFTSGTVNFEYELSDLNVPQRINTPSRARPFSELQAALVAAGLTRRQAGRPRGATPTRTTPTPAASSTPKSASRRYLDCLERAGDDPGKVSACASVIGRP